MSSVNNVRSAARTRGGRQGRTKRTGMDTADLGRVSVHVVRMPVHDVIRMSAQGVVRMRVHDVVRVQTDDIVRMTLMKNTPRHTAWARVEQPPSEWALLMLLLSSQLSQALMLQFIGCRRWRLARAVVTANIRRHRTDAVAADVGPASNDTAVTAQVVVVGVSCIVIAVATLFAGVEEVIVSVSGTGTMVPDGGKTVVR